MSLYISSRRLARARLILSLSAAFCATSAFAQGASAGANDGASRGGAIDEIVVTARKVEENLQETPLAISAVTAEDLARLQIIDTGALSAVAPNVYLTRTSGDSSTLQTFIRGVGGAGNSLLNRDVPVATYLDGAYIARATGAVFELVDIERVEVLRGPQGTLYGRNATGGAISYIARKPGDELSIRQVLGTGSFSRFKAISRLDTGELASGLRASFSYLHDQNNGYVDNIRAKASKDPGANNTDAFRVALAWDNGSPFKANYAFDYSDQRAIPPASQLIGVGPTLQSALNIGVIALSGNPAATVNLGASRKRLGKIASSIDTRVRHETQSHNLTLEADTDLATFKSITTYRKWNNPRHQGDLSGVTLPPLLVLSAATFEPGVNPSPRLLSGFRERHQDQWSQELQMLGTMGDHFKYVVGGHYFREKFREDGAEILLFPIAPTFPALDVTAPFSYSGVNKAWAVFGNGTYTFPMWEERFSISGGLRYTEDTRRYARAADADSKTFDGIGWEASANFKVNDDIYTYARAAKAFNAGGFNMRDDSTPLAPFDQEEVVAYEAGVKSEWFDRRLRINAAAFFTDYQKIQTQVIQTNPAGGVNNRVINGATAEIKGVELEVLAYPVEGLRFQLSWGYADGKYKKYPAINENGTPDPSDDRIVNIARQAKWAAPKTTLFGDVEYTTQPIGSLGWVLKAGVSARHLSSFGPSGTDDEVLQQLPVTTPFNALVRDNGFTTVDARLSVSEIELGSRAKVTVTLFGKNITDTEYLEFGNDFGSAEVATGIFGAPATWGLELSIQY